MTNNKLWYVLGAIFVIAIATYALVRQAPSTESVEATSDYKSATYLIDGKEIKLVNGLSETEAAPGSATRVVTRYFGNEIRKDLDGDGREDVAFIMTQSSGGSGTFYYVVAALDTPSGYVGSQGLLLGDRIAPQTTQSGEGRVVIVNYADRKAGEDFSVPPSVGKSIWLLLDPSTMQFGEVVQNFEGEADPSRMTLGMNKWKWISATYTTSGCQCSEGYIKEGDSCTPACSYESPPCLAPSIICDSIKRTSTITPIKKDAFTILFNKDGRASITTDCNNASGSYSLRGKEITFSNFASTLMYCEGSQESEFLKLLSEVKSHYFTSKGELVLNLKEAGDSMIFR